MCRKQVWLSVCNESTSLFFFTLSRNFWVRVPAACVWGERVFRVVKRDQLTPRMIHCNPIEHVENNDIILWRIPVLLRTLPLQRKVCCVCTFKFSFCCFLKSTLSLKAIKWAVLHVMTNLWQIRVSLSQGAKACAEWSLKLNFRQSLANYLLLFHSLAACSVSLCLTDVHSTWRTRMWLEKSWS